jgi:hypothetical protein
VFYVREEAQHANVRKVEIEEPKKAAKSAA